MSPHYLIIGGTGNIGSAVIEKLQQSGTNLVVAARTPDNIAAGAGLKAVYFDFDNPASWPNALDNIQRIFMIPKVGDPYPDQTLMPFMDLARSRGVERIVFSTAMGLDRDWRVLAAAEEHLQQSGLEFTILRPGWFMQNFTTGFQLPSVRQGVIALPGSSACRLSLIDTRDIGAVAASALSTDEHVGKILTLTGPESLSWNEIAEQLQATAGYNVVYQEVEEKPIRDFLLANGTSPYRVEQMMLMMRSMRDGIFADLSSDVATILNRPAISFSQHLKEFGHLLKQ
jgi:uncharacterized protein YbjT (DUF2867 family)